MINRDRIRVTIRKTYSDHRAVIAVAQVGLEATLEFPKDSLPDDFKAATNEATSEGKNEIMKQLYGYPYDLVVKLDEAIPLAQQTDEVKQLLKALKQSLKTGEEVKIK